MARFVFQILIGAVALPFAVVFWVIAAALVFLIDRISPKSRLKISRRKVLKNALEAHFLPALRTAGFVGPEEFKGNELCFDFRRQRGDTYHFLTIQFEKRGGPEFRINFSEDTTAGMQERLQQIQETRGKAGPGRIPYVGGWFWFSSRGPYCRLSAMLRRTDSAQVLAERTAKLFQQELEAWWERRKTGLHLHLVGQWFPYSPSPTQTRVMRQLLWLYSGYSVLTTGLIIVLLTVVPIALTIRLINWLISK